MNENKEEFSTRKKIVHIVIVILAIALFFGGVYGLLVWTGLWDKVNSVDKVKNLILSMGFYGRTIFASDFFANPCKCACYCRQPCLWASSSIAFVAFRNIAWLCACVLFRQNFWQKACHFYGWQRKLQQMDKIFRQRQI